MCSITVHDKQKSTYVDDTRSGGSISITKHATTSALQALGDTLDFIYCCLQHFQHNEQEILIMYHEAMIYLFKKNL